MAEKMLSSLRSGEHAGQPEVRLMLAGHRHEGIEVRLRREGDRIEATLHDTLGHRDLSALASAVRRAAAEREVPIDLSVS